MSKTKKTGLEHYEMLYIIPNKFTEDEAVKINEKVKKIIKDKEGNITFSEEWGKKRLAYPIEHFNHGYYNLVEFDLDKEKFNLLDKALRMTNEVLRFQIIKKKVKTVEQIKKEEKIAEKIVAKKVKED